MNISKHKIYYSPDKITIIMTQTTLSAKLAKFWDELPTRIFLFFMASDDPTYGNGAWYKPLGGPRTLTPPRNRRQPVFTRKLQVLVLVS